MIEMLFANQIKKQSMGVKVFTLILCLETLEIEATIRGRSYYLTSRKASSKLINLLSFLSISTK